MGFTKEIINGYEICIKDNYCEVYKNGKNIVSSSLAEGTTHIDVFNILTRELQFTLNGKALCSYSLYHTFPGEKEATLESLAIDNNCDIEDIKYSIVLQEITEHIKVTNSSL